MLSVSHMFFSCATKALLAPCRGVANSHFYPLRRVRSQEIQATLCCCPRAGPRIMQAGTLGHVGRTCRHCHMAGLSVHPTIEKGGGEEVGSHSWNICSNVALSGPSSQHMTAGKRGIYT